MLAGGAVAWTSRKQKTVALSSTEAEYISLSDASQQIVWVETLFDEIGTPIQSIKLSVDNQGTIFWTSNPAQEHHSKHIDICYHYVHKLIQSKKVVLKYIPTNEQNAD
jgi:hypothetical protein